jgi:hypothetical protein
MTTLREAALMALGALEYIDSPLHVREINIVGRAIAALDAALEQSDHTEQTIEMVSLPEPVAWNWMLGGFVYGPAYSGRPPDEDIVKASEATGRTVRLLYAHPPQRKWQGLTHEERDAICKDFVGDDDRVSAYRSFALEVEVRLTEKNK